MIVARNSQPTRNSAEHPGIETRVEEEATTSEQNKLDRLTSAHARLIKRGFSRS